MMTKLDVHANHDGKSRVIAHVSDETGFVTVRESDARATFYLTIEQTRAIVADLTKGLAEHDLIAKAKAEAATQVEAA